MSYDVRLCLPQADRTDEEIATADAIVAEGSEVVPEKEARKRRVADALLAFDSTLERFHGDETEPGRGPIELNSTAGARNIQIALFDDEASISISYGLPREGVRARFESIWDYLKIMEREGGYFVFDPQIGRVLDLTGDFEVTLACYGQASRLVQTSGPAVTKERASGMKWVPAELDRLSYFYRWCALSCVALLAFLVVMRLTLNTRMEALVLVPSAGWFVCKMLLLDVARLRSIGWSPRVTFMSIFPPIGVFLQLMLFFVEPKRA